MTLPRPFQLERYFALHEFKARHFLSASDCETLSVHELLRMADRDSLTLWERLSLGYTETPGHPVLREEISGLYRDASPDDILVVAPAEGIFLFMQSLLVPGDHVIVMSPCFQSLTELPSSIGCAVDRWELRPVRERWEADVGRLEGYITPRTRLIVVNSPHNPTGFQLSREELDAIVALARRHGLYVFSDEIYRFLEYQPDQRLPSVCDLYERGVVLGGLSKSFGLPGLRIGWLVTKDAALRERFVTFKDYTTICSAAPSEILAIIALRARESILDRNRGIVLSNLQAAEDFFNRTSDRFQWLPPRAGSVAFPEWKGPGPLEEFCADLLRRGVLIAPAGLFDFEGPHFRLGLGRRGLAEALPLLAADPVSGRAGSTMRGGPHVGEPSP